MLAIADEPDIRSRIHPLSVEAYRRLAELNLIPQRSELIRGAIVEKPVQLPLHASVVEMLRDFLDAHLPPGFIVRQEKPITLPDSEPEPDLVIVAGKREDFRHAHPQAVALALEVCVSTEKLDRLKLKLYAEAGIAEYWLILAEARAIERHTEPSVEGYRWVERAVAPATLVSTVFPHLSLPPADLFPAS